MSLGIAPLSSYDADVCYLQYIEENYFWVQPRSSCTMDLSPECTWNFAQGLNPQADYIPIPSNYSLTQQYTCDNRLYNLSWVNKHTGQMPNRYLCTCGEPILSEYTEGCSGRCDRPWTAAFDKQCNVVSQLSSAKANYSSNFITQGVCVQASGQGVANTTFQSDLTVGSSEYSIIDGIGISQACNNQPFDSSPRICNCDGALPEYAWGQKIEYRDPCGLEKKANMAWIAAPVVGGIVLAFCLILAGFLLRRRTRLKKAQVSEENCLADIVTNKFERAARLEDQSTLTNRPSAGMDFSTPSETSVQSFDSGASLLMGTGNNSRKQ